jgi:hypothetical protein
MYVPHRRSRVVGAVLWLVTRPAYLIVWALFLASDLGERLNAHLGDWSWRDLAGSLLFLPLAIGIVHVLGVGVHLLGLLFGVMR